MYPEQIHHYLYKFFEENHCEILSEHKHYITVQLTIEMDKKIMNRPYYWQYIESAAIEPSPAQLTFITDKNKLVENIKGEVVHFGSPRLNQLFAVTKDLGAFVQIYERVPENTGKQIILTPWLGVNYKISYCSDQTKEVLYSLGMNLMTGEVIDGFQELISRVDMDVTVSGNPFTLPYTIKPVRALERLERAIENLIRQEDHRWAEEAKTRLEKDRRVLDYFYEGVVNKPESYEIEKKALEEQYETKIKIDVINGGLFYLK